MPHDLPKTYDPRAIEDRWAAYWVAERIFEQATPAAGQSNAFTMLLPPPNVTGRLHMGHMLNQTEMDILARWHRMQGEPTLWVPGTDHAGIATQMMVERQLAAEKTSRQELGRDRFIERVWEWKGVYGGAILDQMKRLGASVDWSREYFTMDDTLSVAVREAFVRLYEQGLIYRGNYIVNWDPVQQTAVSDLEVTHEDRAGKLYYVRYELADGTASIVIATTRPETMLGDTAVAVHPEDTRYQALHGRLLRLPLSAIHGGQDRTIPVIADTWANPEFGTGAVKVTPAHDPNDYAIGERHALPKPIIMDQQAQIDLPGSPYHGLDRYVARERIVDDLRALGALVDVKDHPMSIGKSQRTGAVIEPRLSTQWFLKIQPLAEKAIAAVEHGHIRFTPDQYRKTYDEWMRNIRDWCLSRQLWWGHRIPAWHCYDCSHITVARHAPDTCSQCGGRALTQETDVLDTWFSAGLLPFTVFGWGGQDTGQMADLAAFYPTQLLVTGFDIIFFWVARMIMLGCWFMGELPLPDGSARSLAQSVPFREVYIHALVRDADKQKMSKTKGNVIDPIEIVSQYGTDAVRFTLAAMASPGTDIAFSEARTEGYRAFANKIWNAARFVFRNIDLAADAGIVINQHSLAATPAPAVEAPLEARGIHSRLNTTVAEVNAALAEYRFHEAASLVYQFFWGDFCDWYLEMVKLRLDFSGDADKAAIGAALTTLLATFDTALRLLSPFMPFLTEELWHAVYDGAPPARSIALSRYPQAGPVDVDAEKAMALLQELITTIRVARKELAMPERLAAETRIRTSIPGFDPASHALILQKLAYVSSIGTGAMDPALPRKAAANFDVQVLFERILDPAVEGMRLSKEIEQLQKSVERAGLQLADEAFLGRAPSHIVEAMRLQRAQNLSLLEKKRADLNALTLKR